MNLADDVAGVAPAPSPRIGQTWMEPLGIFIYKAFLLTGRQKPLLNPTGPQNNFSQFVGNSGNVILRSYV